jgi:hypothetical protein
MDGIQVKSGTFLYWYGKVPGLFMGENHGVELKVQV